MNKNFKFIILIFLIVSILFINLNNCQDNDEEVDMNDNSNSDVIILTDSNFEDLTTSNPNETWMVEFYAPWCFHCKNLKKTYDQLSTKLKQQDPNLKVAKIDCVANPKQCKRFSIRSYPTIKVIKGNSVYDMKGEKTLNSLNEFINKGYEKSDQIKQLPASIILKVVDLTDKTFPSVNDGSWLIYFHIPRCIYCEKFMSEFDALPSADFSKSNEKFNFGKINCQTYKEICDLYRVEYFPNVKFFENSTNLYYNFNHEPTTSNLKEFAMFYYKHVSPIKRPWNAMFSLFEEAIREFVWLFLLVSFLFGFFICYIFYGMSPPSPTPPPLPSSSSSTQSKNQIQTKMKKSDLNSNNQGLNSNEQAFGSPSNMNESMVFGSPSSSVLSSSFKGSNSTCATNKSASSAMFSRPFYYE
ncbi:hypothetical protein ACTFIY_003069 [Dictyostelium cf. discoideum]